MTADCLSHDEVEALLEEITIKPEDWQAAQELLDQQKMQPMCEDGAALDRKQRFKPSYIRDVIDRHALNYDLDAAPDWVKGALTDVKDTSEKPLTLEHVKSIVRAEYEQSVTNVDTAIARRDTWETLHYLLSRVK